MKKIECPSCAMEVNRDTKVCPICGYEFPRTGSTIKWIAILLILLFLLALLF